MKHSFRLFPLFWLALALLPLRAGADEPAPHPDVRVLIDVSGSMKQNDPNNLRKPALDLLLNLFPKDAKVGVWTFGQEVDVLAPHQPVSDAWRAQARKKIGRITSNSLYTNIPAALERAAYDLERPDKGYRVSLILLTDGMVDISKSPAENAAARTRLLDEILPRLRRAGVIVHTVALSKSADRELMERLAGDTHGLFAVAETADDLNRVFLQAFDAAAPAEQVPLAGNHFLVDSSIDELTALVFHAQARPLELVAPDNRRHSFARHGDDVRWFQGRGFDLITVQKPFEGEWTVVAETEPGSRVTILSNLSLAVSRLPDGLFVSGAAPALTAALKQQGEVMKEPELLKLVRFSATVQRREDGRQWQVELGAGDAPPADGYFHVQLPMLAEAGNYDIAVNADGKTFQRSQRQTVAVRQPFAIRVVPTDTIPAGHRVSLFAQNPDIDLAASAVTAHIKGPDGAGRDQAVAAGADREWPLLLEPGAQGGRFEVSFEVDGRYRKGDRFSYRSETIALDGTGTQAVAAAPGLAAPAPVPAKQPENQPDKPADKQSDKPPAEPPAAPPAQPAWRKWLLYGGLALGNVLVLGLGFFAFRRILGSGQSPVLAAPDEEAPAAEPEPEKPARPGRRAAKLAALDLPDDAIDIDPAKE